jgi:hypothetical protein
MSTLATLSSEPNLTSTCVLSEIGLPSTTLSPYIVFAAGSKVTLKPHFLSSDRAASTDMPGCIFSLMCFSQPCGGALWQENCQITVPIRKRAYAIFLAMQALSPGGGRLEGSEKFQYAPPGGIREGLQWQTRYPPVISALIHHKLHSRNSQLGNDQL